MFFRLLTVWLVLIGLGCGTESGEKEKLDLVGAKDEPGIPDQAHPSAPQASESLHQRSFVVDLIQDIVFRKIRDGWDLTTSKAHVNVDKLKAGGVDLIFSALPMTPGVAPGKSLERGIKLTKELVDGTNGQMEIVSSFSSARNIQKKGVIPVMLMIEGADALDGRLDSLFELKKNGVLLVGIVGSRGNAFGDTAVSPKKNGGLTEKGKVLLEACRDSSIVVDLTHASPKTFWDTLLQQMAGIVVSHTAVRFLRDHPRNLDDLQIIALSRYGGVMGLLFNPDFIKAGESASLDDIVAHVMHVKAIGAINALALGTDFGGINPPSGMKDVAQLPALTEALKRQGLSDVEIEGILGENAARVFEEVEQDRGAARLVKDDILRPVAIECDVIIGESEGTASLACNGYLKDIGATLHPSGKQKVRIRDVNTSPVKFEIFGEAGTPWQVEGQNLDGKVLLNRTIALDEIGKGSISLPSNRNLTRLFLSPTRPSALREVVVWGR